MKVIPIALASHMTGEVTTLAQCWKITRRDGEVFGFTSHDANFEFDGVVYLSSSAMTPSQVEVNGSMAVDNLDVIALLDNDLIVEADIFAGKWDYASVELFRVNWADLSQGAERLITGRLGEVSFGGPQFVAELRSLTQSLQQTIGRAYGPSCDVNLGDSICGINLASWTETGAVTTVTSQSAFSDSSRTEDANYFRYGKLLWLTGNNAGISIEVKETSGSPATDFELQDSMPYVIQIGDTYSVYKGCNKVRTDTENGCASFDNVENFQGFDMIPGSDRLMSGK